MEPELQLKVMTRTESGHKNTLCVRKKQVFSSKMSCFTCFFYSFGRLNFQVVVFYVGFIVFFESGPFLLDFHVGFHTPCSQLVVFYIGFDVFLVQSSQIVVGLEMLQILVSEASWKPSLGSNA